MTRALHMLLLAVLFSAVAGLTGAEAASFVPTPPKGKGDKCVADTDFMRRNHMTVLNHQRDDTVHEGIRTKRFSLKECIDCHAVNGPDAKPVSADSPQHFCRTCHDFAAVKVDCFECHASRPEQGEAGQALDTDPATSMRAALADYLEGKGQ